MTSTTTIIHSEKTLRQLSEARAKHAAKCEKIITTCIICAEHFGIERTS